MFGILISAVGAVPLFAASASGDFVITATVNPSMGLYCNGAGTGCTTGAVNFGDITSTYMTTQNLYMAATIADNTAVGGPDIYYKLTDANNTPNASTTFQLKGTQNTANTMSLRVGYRGCKATAYTYPAVGVVQPLSLTQASTIGPCAGYTSAPSMGTPVPNDPAAGGGALFGTFSFTIPAQANPPNADVYTDTINVSMCSSTACT